MAENAREAIEMTKETNRRLEESMKILGTREESRKRSLEMEIYLQQNFRRLEGVAIIIVRSPTFRARMLLPPLQYLLIKITPTCKLFLFFVSSFNNFHL
ncbi:unnamed protein product [Caenorhabditis brenneri]